METVALSENGIFKKVEVRKSRNKKEIEFKSSNGGVWLKASPTGDQHNMRAYAAKDYSLQSSIIDTNLPGEWGDYVYPMGVVVFMRPSGDAVTEQDVTHSLKTISRENGKPVPITDDEYSNDDVDLDESLSDSGNSDTEENQNEEDSDSGYDTTESENETIVT